MALLLTPAICSVLLCMEKLEIPAEIKAPRKKTEVQLSSVNTGNVPSLLNKINELTAIIRLQQE